MTITQAAKKEILRSYVDVAGLGLEIGPQANGIVPKREGFNCRIADWASGQVLRNAYKTTPGIDETLIEDVDYVTGGQPLCEVIEDRGTFDYIIASHVIEHIPDPVRFLNDCQKILKASGPLVLAIPDKRYIFDVLRPVSSLGDIMQAHIEKRVKHPAGKQLDLYALGACRGGGYIWGPEHAGELIFLHSLKEAKTRFDKARNTEGYIDTHGWCFTPASFRLLIRDLEELEELSLKEVQFSCHGPEFFVSLSETGTGPKCCRIELARLMVEEIGSVKP